MTQEWEAGRLAGWLVRGRVADGAGELCMGQGARRWSAPWLLFGAPGSQSGG